MSSILVIKVKCGDTLRRFNTRVVGNERLELSMAQLREKIRRLFSLGVDDDDFTLTYTDTDGDTVTLVEDCDLDDVVFQGLNPVRIFVNLKMGYGGGFCDVGAGQDRTIENLPAGFEEGVMLKATRDLAAGASGPVVSDMVHSVSKIGESVSSQGSQTLSEKGSNFKNGDEEGEVSSGLNSDRNAELRKERLADEVRKVEAKAIDSGVYGVPDINIAPPLPSEFLTTMAASSGHSNYTGIGDTWLSPSVEEELSIMDVNLFNECPFSGTQVDAMFHPSRDEPGYHIPQFKRSHSQFVPESPVFHTGVQCDICGIQPITGPRFISKVRFNYDLCSLCYQKSGSKDEYARIDNPLMFREVLKAFHYIQKIGGHGHKAVNSFKPIADPYVPVPIRPRPTPLGNKRLDSRFISDVNIMDGTVMAPSVHFTKIWRMKNTGNVVWPMGTKLVWVDGKKFSVALSVNLEIPADGLAVNSELDVAVDFISPALPGGYVSYWRLLSPSGRKFGQRVWVAIQVDRSHDQLNGAFSRLNLNLNLPPQNNLSKNLGVMNLNVEPSMNKSFSPSSSSTAVAASSEPTDQQSNTVGKAVVELFAEVLDEGQEQLVSKGSISETTESANHERSLSIPTVSTLLLGDAFCESPSPPVASSVPHPHENCSDDIEVGTLPMNASSNVETLVPSPQSENFSVTSERGELSEVDINQAEFNNEILEMMDFQVEQARDFLCGNFGWERTLDELEKMGFSDKKKNLELVLKNKGSIKRVVMDLVACENSQE